jgi:hypothetical protein
VPAYDLRRARQRHHRRGGGGDKLWGGRGNDVFVLAAGSDHQLLAAIGYGGTDAVADHWLNQKSGRDQKIVVSCSNKEIEKIEDVA